MTVEAAMRIRARRASRIGAACLVLAIGFLLASFLFTPRIVLRSDVSFELPPVSAGDKVEGAKADSIRLVAILVSSATIFFACYLLGRHASKQLELSTRLIAIADALCIADDDFQKFEKCVSLLLPSITAGANDELISLKDLKNVLDLVKAK